MKIDWWMLLLSFLFIPLLLDIVARVKKKHTVKHMVRQMAERVSSLEAAALNLTEQAQMLQKENERLSRLARTHMEKNEMFEQQAKDAWARYHAAGLMAGNAQAWLLRELEGAVVELNRYRQKASEPPIEVDPKLAPMVAEFKRLHGEGQ